MKPLLEFNSPTYLRRLARELNALPDGFYYQGQRFNHARVSSMAGEGGKLCTLCIQRPDESELNTIHSVGISGTARLVDAYGREVVASRRAR